MLRKYFTAHPATIGETYFEHFAWAVSFSGTMFVGSIACLVHAFVPGFFVHTGSGIVERLHQRMVTRVPMTARSDRPRVQMGDERK